MRCSASISTISNGSTTRSGIRSAICCCNGSPRGCAPSCCEQDTIARLGGDEFAILQADVGKPEEVSRLLARLLTVINEPFELEGHHVTVGASIGVALAPGDGDDPDRLLKNADMALYRAKAEGKGSFRFFESEMDARVQARRRLEMDLRGALKDEIFEVHYQPLVSLASGEVRALEALIRWPHPEQGMIPPSDFIPVAEETGLIAQIGLFVLRQACADAAQWPARRQGRGQPVADAVQERQPAASRQGRAERRRPAADAA